MQKGLPWWLRQKNLAAMQESLWPGRRAAVDNGTEAVRLRENFRPLARKRNFRGRRGKAAWWVTFS